MNRFSVIDKKTGNVLLKRVSRLDVLNELKISSSTFYKCLEEDYAFKKRYVIQSDDFGSVNLNQDYIKDFTDRWKEMQKLFGIKVEETVYEFTGDLPWE